MDFTIAPVDEGVTFSVTNSLFAFFDFEYFSKAI